MPDLYACAMYVLDHMNKADGGISNLHKTILLKSYKRTLTRFMAKNSVFGVNMLKMTGMSPQEVTPNCNSFEINILTARALQITGNGQNALNDIFFSLGSSHTGLHKKSFQHSLKTKLHPVSKSACKENLSKCATAVKDLYTKLNFGTPGNIAASSEGTWHTRGHSFSIGTAAVIELFLSCA